jgi:hypothetical protein
LNKNIDTHQATLNKNIDSHQVMLNKNKGSLKAEKGKPLARYLQKVKIFFYIYRLLVNLRELKY